MVCITYVNGMFGTAQFSVVFMKQNQNSRHNRQGRPSQHSNQKRPSKGRHNQNRQQQSNSPNRQMDSRGPAGNQRGNAKQLYERYKTLAQEKRASDRLESEALYQYADHYYRLYDEFASVEAATQAARDKTRQEEQAKKQQEEDVRQVNAAEKQIQHSAPVESSESGQKEQQQEPQRKPRRKPQAKAEEKSKSESESPIEKPEAEAVNP